MRSAICVGASWTKLKLRCQCCVVRKGEVFRWRCRHSARNFTLSCLLLGNNLSLTVPSSPRGCENAPVRWLGYGSGPKHTLVSSQVTLFAGLWNQRSDVVEVPLIITAAREVPFYYPFARSSELEDTSCRGSWCMNWAFPSFSPKVLHYQAALPWSWQDPFAAGESQPAFFFTGRSTQQPCGLAPHVPSLSAG